MRVRPIVLAGAWSLSAAPAVAELRADRGLEVGGRIGYAVALGELAEDQALSDSIRGMVPLWLELGYRLMPELMAGLWLQTGFGFLGHDLVDDCDAAGLDCTVFDLRLGVQGQYHFRPVQRLDPWLGLGVGYEWLSLSSKGDGADSTLTYRGWELLTLQGGLDVVPRSGVGVGPFTSFSIGRYDSTVRVVSDDAVTSDVEDGGLHHWLVFGVRGTFVL